MSHFSPSHRPHRPDPANDNSAPKASGANVRTESETPRKRPPALSSPRTRNLKIRIETDWPAQLPVLEAEIDLIYTVLADVLTAGLNDNNPEPEEHDPTHRRL